MLEKMFPSDLQYVVEKIRTFESVEKSEELFSFLNMMRALVAWRVDAPVNLDEWWDKEIFRGDFAKGNSVFLRAIL
jgi:hypothetical protein